MSIFIEIEEAAQIIRAAEFILRIIGNVQGRAESYAARRDNLKVITFPDIGNNAPAGESQSSDTLTAPQKENQMLLSIDVPGISINATPRKDGRFQGYATRDGEKSIFTAKPAKRSNKKLRGFGRKVKQKKEKRLYNKKAPRCSESLRKNGSRYIKRRN